MCSKSYKEPRSRAVIERVTPEVDGGRHPIKRVIGESVVVEADIFADGHDVVSAVLLFRQAGEAEWTETPLTPLGNDRWLGEFKVTQIGNALYCIEAWVDHFKSWRQGTQKKLKAGQDVSVELLAGALFLDAAAARAEGADAACLKEWAQEVRARWGGDTGGRHAPLAWRRSSQGDDAASRPPVCHPLRP